MVVEVAAGVDLLLPVGEERVQVVLLRAAAGEVLVMQATLSGPSAGPWTPRM